MADGRAGLTAQSLSAPRGPRVSRERLLSAMKVKTRARRDKNMDELIAAVQARECLWDNSYRGHRNRFMLETYWNEVAAEVGSTNLYCRKRWKNLKDQCRKEMKKNPHDSDWPHFQKLNFIHHQFLNDDEDNEDFMGDEAFNAIDKSIKTPKLGYTMRKKILMNKRRTIDVDMNKLIDLVKAREIIWNRQLKGHHNWYKMDESWKEIEQELGVTHLYCRKRWKNLKDHCRKEMKKNPHDSDWPHFHKLKFIHDQFLIDDEDNEDFMGDEAFNALDESIKTPKLGYTMRKKLLMNKRRTIDVDMNKLIDLVKVREIVWNRQLKCHDKWCKLDESWKEIAQELGVTLKMLSTNEAGRIAALLEGSDFDNEDLPPTFQAWMYIWDHLSECSNDSEIEQ